MVTSLSVRDDAAQAVRSRHVPRSIQEAEEARRRLAFEELLVLQLRLLLQRTSLQCASLHPAALLSVSV
jgi:RecG-like helicase